VNQNQSRVLNSLTKPLCRKVKCPTWHEKLIKLLQNVLQQYIQNDQEKSMSQNVLREQKFAANEVHVAKSKQTSRSNGET